MNVLSPEGLHRALRDGRRGGAYFVFGEEEHLKDEVVAALVDAHLDVATRDFNLDVLRAADTPPETLSSIVATPPLLAEWRVVILRDVQAMAVSARARSVLEQLLERPIPGLLFVLTAQIPGRAQFYETLKKRSTPVECRPLSDADLPGWLLERAAARGVSLDPDAALQLVSAVGSELGILLQELNKLTEFAGQRQRITIEDVHGTVGRIERMGRWQWFDLVGQRKFNEARAALPALLDAGENGVGLCIGLGAQFLRIAVGAAGGQRLLESALPPNQKWLAGRILGQARAWTVETAERVLEDLLRADRLLKSTSMSDLQVLEELLFRMQARTEAAA
jgi:DNA polymerase-3 subunit delta